MIVTFYVFSTKLQPRCVSPKSLVVIFIQDLEDAVMLAPNKNVIQVETIDPV